MKRANVLLVKIMAGCWTTLQHVQPRLEWKLVKMTTTKTNLTNSLLLNCQLFNEKKICSLRLRAHIRYVNYSHKATCGAMRCNIVGLDWTAPLKIEIMFLQMQGCLWVNHADFILLGGRLRRDDYTRTIRQQPVFLFCRSLISVTADKKILCKAGF